MIQVTRLNGTILFLNPELIEMVERTADTVITLVNDKKLIVRENPETIRERYLEYRRQVQPIFTAHSDR